MRYIREALKIFIPKNDGVIINISSVNGNRPFCGATYTSTKGALNTLTKNVAEISGVMPNPTLEKLYEGVTITREHQADLLLVVGGDLYVIMQKRCLCQ